MKLGLIDLNTGNLESLKSAITKLNIKYKICKNSFDFEEVDKIILPGVGAFKDFMTKLNSSGISKIILNKIEKNISILGVCVGFQVLFSESSEHGKSKGLNILNGKIINFKDISKQIKVPHVGWNECQIINKENLLNRINTKPKLFLLHGDMDSIVPPNHLLESKEFFLKIDYKVKTKLLKNCEHHISTEASSLALEFIKNNLYK